ncbi:MAG: DUF3187 family protein [Gammaproteobacteria bacterium]
MKGLSIHQSLLAFTTGILCLAGVKAEQNEPLRTRNLAPLVAVFGLPTWESDAAVGESELAVVQELASHFRLAGRGDEQLVLDGETWRTSFFYKRGIADGWTIGVELPVIRQWGGVLDDLIDGWHSTFDLPDGNRNRAADDQIRFLYRDNNATQFSFSDSSTGLGDTQVSIARRLGAESGMLLRAIVKLPTGDEDIFAGSGSTDLTLTLLKQSSTVWREHEIGYYWGAGLMFVGEPTYLADRNEDWAAVGVFGLGWQPSARLGLKAQLDFHSRFYDSALDELGKDSIQASIGVWWAFDDRRRLNFAINEDLIVRTAPDVSFHFDFSWAL